MKVILTDKARMVRSPTYNYNFDVETGYFERWGKTEDEDPTWSPYGPEIMDIEISEGEGCPMTCAFCYKGNKKGNTAINMSLETFRSLFAKFPKTVTQIAFGITSIGTHPELFDIFQHCRDNMVVPNVTINGADPLTDEQISKLISVVGAMAISLNKTNFEKGLDLIDRLTKAGAKQTNVHYVISRQTIDFAYTVCNAITNDPRMKGLNAIVFLGLKPKSRGQSFDVLPIEAYIRLVNHCLENNIPFGFDSCSAPRFDRAIEISTIDEAKKKLMSSCSERCESGLFSAYLDSTGKYWHCSFGEGMEVAYGIDVTKVEDFTKDVWLSAPMTKWRTRLLELNRECPLYKEIHIDPSAATGVFPEKV